MTPGVPFSLFQGGNCKPASGKMEIDIRVT